MKKFSSLSDLKSLIDKEDLNKPEEIINPSLKKVIPQNLEAHFSVKGRAGKPVTVIKGFNGSKDELKDLAKLLKNKCSVGGSIKNNEIIIQGKFREKITLILESQGHKVKELEVSPHALQFRINSINNNTKSCTNKHITNPIIII